jgi:1-acyl-sn-glycerol-3-phosphate acyltransferase
MGPGLRILKFPWDMLVLAVSAPLFFVAYPAMCLPWLAAHALLGRPPDLALQVYSHWFFRWFFALAAGLSPGVRLRLDPALRQTRGCVLVCNHVSYLDPLILVSLLPRHTTLIKATWTRTPVFGWFVRRLGFIPAMGALSGMTEARIQRLKAYLEAGGNLFVFPEGRRARDGRLQPFHKGAFALARLCGAELRAWRIQGTERWFPPGTYWFQTFSGAELQVQELGRLSPDYRDPTFSVPAFAQQVEALYRREPPGP